MYVYHALYSHRSRFNNEGVAVIHRTVPSAVVRPSRTRAEISAEIDLLPVFRYVVRAARPGLVLRSSPVSNTRTRVLSSYKKYVRTNRVLVMI